MAVGRLAPIDRLTLVYLGVASAALAWNWHQPVPLRGLLVLAHLLLVAVVLASPAARAAAPGGSLVAEAYPLLLAGAIYTEIGVLNSAAGVSYDPLIQAWDQALFGLQPARDWIRAQPWPWLSWPLHLGYLGYYAILAGAPLGLWWSGRRDGARRTLLLMMAAFFLCYSTFLVFPVAGPYYFFPRADNPAKSIAAARLVHRLLDGGAAWGTAFPSSHVAASWAAAVSAWWAWRGLGLVLMLASLLLTLGTVYGGFHYGVDTLTGALVAIAVLGIGRVTMGSR
jgi:membrane-associated phospholipid phosphatase